MFIYLRRFSPSTIMFFHAPDSSSPARFPRRIKLESVRNTLSWPREPCCSCLRHGFRCLHSCGCCQGSRPGMVTCADSRVYRYFLGGFSQSGGMNERDICRCGRTTASQRIPNIRWEGDRNVNHMLDNSKRVAYPATMLMKRNGFNAHNPVTLPTALPENSHQGIMNIQL